MDNTYELSIELPPGAVPQHGLGLVAYFNAAGETCYGLKLEGEASVTAILGLIELVKARVLKDSEEW